LLGLLHIFPQLKLNVKTGSHGPVIHLVDVNGGEVTGIKYTAEQTNNELVAHSVSKEDQYYWALPKEFLGNKVTTSIHLLYICVTSCIIFLPSPALSRHTWHEVLDPPERSDRPLVLTFFPSHILGNYSFANV